MQSPDLSKTLRMTRGIRQAAGDVVPCSILARRVRIRAPFVSLTFDDGPDEETTELLDLLDRLRLLATFFLLGQRVEANRSLVTDIVARGHEIASHGWAHRRVTQMSAPELNADLARTQSVLPPSPGRRLFRPPHGDISARSLGQIALAGYTTVLWSIDSFDSRPIGSARIVDGIRQATPRPGDILLLHEGERTTREALPGIASLLRARGLRSVPVSYLLAGHEYR